jgi:hypothetical protein
VDVLPSFDLLEKTQFVPLYRYDEAGTRQDNITDWALKQFTDHYKKTVHPELVEGLNEASTSSARTGKGAVAAKAGKAKKITKEAIFHYCYAVLHNPAYREKYAQNLKREFPRIPFYADFWQWAAWGEALMTLHIGYEKVAPFPLTRTDRRALHRYAEPGSRSGSASVVAPRRAGQPGQNWCLGGRSNEGSETRPMLRRWPSVHRSTRPGLWQRIGHCATQLFPQLLCLCGRQDRPGYRRGVQSRFGREGA